MFPIGNCVLCSHRVLVGPRFDSDIDGVRKKAPESEITSCSGGVLLTISKASFNGTPQKTRMLISIVWKAGDKSVPPLSLKRRESDKSDVEINSRVSRILCRIDVSESVRAPKREVNEVCVIESVSSKSAQTRSYSLYIHSSGVASRWSWEFAV